MSKIILLFLVSIYGMLQAQNKIGEFNIENNSNDPYGNLLTVELDNEKTKNPENPLNKANGQNGVARKSSYITTGEKIIDYGFEDYTGNVETTPGYIFTTSDVSFWSYHIHSTEVVSSCDGKSAFEGNYFLHRQFWTGENDPCLGETATSQNDHGNIGGNFTYPLSGIGDNTHLPTDITSDTITVRYYFRLNNWKTYAGILNWCKFFRLYGTGGSTDTESALLYTYPQNNSNNDMTIFDPSNFATWHFYTGVDFQDGNWHNIVIQVILLNKTNTNPNVRMRVWVDNWNMTGAPQGTRDIYPPTFGSAFMTFALTQNFSASYPSTLISADFDKIEVWDGIPNTNPDPPPSQVQGIQVTAQ